MPTCVYCSGTGTRNNPNYLCMRCQGQGYTGGNTANRCTSCSGRGTTTDRQYVTCEWCGGTGKSLDHSGPTPSRGAKPKQPEAKKAARKSGSPAGVFGLVGAIACWTYLSRTQSFPEAWHAFAISGVAGLLAAWLWKVIAFVIVLGMGVLLFLAVQES